METDGPCLFTSAHEQIIENHKYPQVEIDTFEKKSEPLGQAEAVIDSTE